MADDKRGLKPVLPWTVRLQVFALTAATDAAQRRNGTVNRCVFSLVDLQTSANPRPDAAGVRSTNITVDASRSLWVRVFSPSTTAAGGPPSPVLVYFHGGGFTMLSAASRPFDALCRRFCRELGAVVVSVNYRLAPEHRFPAAYDDGFDVLRFLDSNGLPGVDVAIDLSSCFLSGDSAGGNIVHHVAQRWTAMLSSASTSVRLAGVVLMQAFFGGEERTASELRLEGVAPVVNMRQADWSWKAFLPEGADRNHPAAHVSVEETGEEVELAEGFPPAMVVVGGFDPLQDWQRRYAEMLRRKGKTARVVEYPEAIHGFYIFPELAESGKLLEEMKLFLEAHMHKSTAEGM